MFEMSLPHWPLDKKKSMHPAAFMRVNKCGFFYYILVWCADGAMCFCLIAVGICPLAATTSPNFDG
jgi:hypothetical protein